MNKSIRTFLALGFMLSLMHHKADSSETLREIKLPAEISRSYAMKIIAKPSNTSDSKLQFAETGKSILRDHCTNAPKRIIGAPERIQGFAQLNNDNIEGASRAFLKSKESELGLRGIDLGLLRATKVNGRWYVTFRQTYKGMDVMLTEVELRIFENGNVALYGADVIPAMDISVIPKLGYEAAVNMLNKEIDGKASVDRLHSSKTPSILPIKTSQGVTCRLVWRTELVTGDGRRYINYIDANEGESIWRFEKTRAALSGIEVSGLVKEKKATDKPNSIKFSNMYVNVGEKEYLTDGDGKIKIDLAEDVPIKATLAGPYVKVTKKNMGKSASLADTLSPEENFAIEWNDNNSHAYERSVFYYTNFIHNDLKNIDPDLNYMDYQMNVVVDFAGESPNAYSNGADTIMFICASSSKMNMPETASILYHEYTHAINDQIYANLGSKDGMINSSSHEALADIYPCLIIREPKIGLGSFRTDSNKYIRCVENEYTFPEDITTESHHNGQILAGAFWDLAKTTSFDYVKRLSHFAKYGMPDDPNIGIAFSEWFLETLIADDDDGDLTNGTPHSKEIITAFNKHHIGTDLLMLNSFQIVPLPDTQDTLHAFPISIDLQPPAVPTAGLENVKVIYSTDNWATSIELTAVKNGDDKYVAHIPKQPAGAFVSYYVQAKEISSGRDINLIKSKFSDDFLSFTVGYKTAYVNECESGEGWKFGDTSDYESFGLWECAAPKLVDLTTLSDESFGLMQIGQDHSKNGEKCFVTDAAGTDYSAPIKYITHMAVGKRTLLSPPFSLKNFKKPIIRFWRFNTLSKFAYPEKEPTFSVYLSGDEGASWTLAATYKTSTTDWKPELINLPALIPAAGSVTFKFVAQNDLEKISQTFNHCEALIDDIEFLDLSSALSASDDYNDTHSVAVYPNPATDIINIRTSEPAAILITDALGRVLIAVEGTTGLSEINVASLPKGIYFMKAIFKDNTRVCKFIKR